MERIEQARRPDPFADLNEAQHQAVEHDTGPLLIIAGAGSGKTKALSCRVARLIERGADPSRLLLLTFSRRAAADMTRRVSATLAGVAAIGDMKLPWAGTFHAIGAKLLREYAPLIGLSGDFSIHDRGDSGDLMGLVRSDLGLGGAGRRFPAKGACLAIYSRAVNSEQDLPDVLGESFPWCRHWEAELKHLFAAYVDAKQKQNVLDYDDLLLYWAALLEEPSLAQETAQRFDHVLVDEYQDTNRLQARILLALKPDGQGLTVVGDDAQSIYSFRAATVRNILDFPAAFAPPAKIIALEQNYRSSASILAASNAVIELARERFAKTLYSKRPEGARPKLVSVRDEGAMACYVAHHILEARERGAPLMHNAVLFRASDASTELELELRRRDIPFRKFGGLKFLEAAHVKDVLAILRWAQNPTDRLAGHRTLMLLPGVGPASAGKIVDASAAGGSLEALRVISPPMAALEAWRGLRDLVQALADKGAWPSPMEILTRWYEPILEAHYDDAAARASDIAQLQQIAGGYSTLDAFLTDVTLDPPNATSAHAGPPHRDDDYVILSTIHSAKGQEWRNVFVLNVVDGCIPADLGAGASEEIEEERRLLYVAMTRAKDELHLMQPQRFYVKQQSRRGDAHVYGARSRFLPDTILGRFELCQWPVAGSAQDRPAAPPIAPLDLTARARARWAN